MKEKFLSRGKNQLNMILAKFSQNGVDNAHNFQVYSLTMTGGLNEMPSSLVTSTGGCVCTVLSLGQT